MPVDFDHLLDVSPALFLAADAEGTIVAARGSWSALLGHDPADLLGTNVHGLVHPDDLERTQRIYAEAYRGDAPLLEYEVRNLHADGSHRWISWYAPPPLDGIGYATGVDVTARKLERDQLADARSRLRSVLETVPFYVLRVDRAGTIEYINHTYPGVTREQVIGTNLLNWIPAEQRSAMQEAIDRVLAGHGPTDLITQGSAERGFAWYRSRLGPLVRDGEVIALTIVAEDITDERRDQAHAIQTSRLEAIGQVAGGVAHDFNNLLTVMGGELALLELELEGAQGEVAESLVGLRTAIRDASNMTRGLLEAVRARAASRDDRTELVAGIERLLRVLKLAAGGALELDFVTEVECLHVGLAEHELQQVLLNLVVNSREAIRGAGRIALQLSRTELDGDESWLPAGGYARLVYQDDGPGIDADLLPRVLEPFATTKESGTGFGLASCAALARARGGSIAVECPPEGGTRVTLLLPELDAGARRDEASSPTPAVLRRSATVLLADDNDALRSNMARYLTRHGHTVLEARDGIDAMEVLECHPEGVDVVVTDLAMPRRDGIELARLLRTRDPELAILAMSGNCSPAQGAELESLGARFLHKPFSPSELLGAISAGAPSDGDD